MKMNLRTRFVATFVSLTVAIVAGLTMVSYWIASRAVERQMDESMDNTVHQVMTGLDSWLGERMNESRFFGDLELLKAACQGRRRDEAGAWLESYHKLSSAYENLFLADTNGVIFMDAIGGKSVGISLASQAGFAANLEKARHGQQSMSAVQASPATGRPICLVATPIMENGVFRGIIGTPLELSAFSDSHLSGLKIGQEGFVSILDDHGECVAHKDPSLVLKMKVADLDWGRQVLALKNGRLEYTLNGAARVNRFITDEKNGWIIMAIQPKAEITATITAIRDTAVIFGLGAVAVMVAATWLLTGNLVRRVQQIVSALTASAAQNTAAAHQVSGASQSLAQGAGEQAASIEETSSSLEEMASMTKRNAENAQKANDLARQARQAADKGAADMQAMAAAMEAIKSSSDDIAKIIKTIDEIAFQTNILALNAAVEAARAGEAGMGFAVVADEVRNLAQRSAQAAKETALKIESAISRTGQGVQITGQVRATLDEIVNKARQVDELASEVAGASREQTQGISQINQAVGRMDKVTQSNAASAEESAAAAEELNAQAEMMRQSVTELLRLVGGDQQTAASEPVPMGAKSPAVTRRPAPLVPPSAVNGNGHAKNGQAHGRVPKMSAPEASGRRNEIPLAGDFKDF